MKAKAFLWLLSLSCAALAGQEVEEKPPQAESSEAVEAAKPEESVETEKAVEIPEDLSPAEAAGENMAGAGRQEAQEAQEVQESQAEQVEQEEQENQAAISQPTSRQQTAITKRAFRYVFSTDLGFLLGFNGPELTDKADHLKESLGSYFISGSNLRYGFSVTLNWGMVWLFKGRKRLQAEDSSSAGLLPQTLVVREPKLGNQHRWTIGFQLRNMVSIGDTSLTYFNKKHTPGNFYSQQDRRVFYAFQPVVSASVLFSPLWELQLFIGPSLNLNFYQRSLEEYYLANFKMPTNNRTETHTSDSDELDVFSFGAVGGVSFSRYFYSFLSVGLSAQFMLNVSPYRGEKAARLSLGQFVFGLYMQLSL